MPTRGLREIYDAVAASGHFPVSHIRFPPSGQVSSLRHLAAIKVSSRSWSGVEIKRRVRKSLASLCGAPGKFLSYVAQLPDGPAKGMFRAANYYGGEDPAAASLPQPLGIY